MAETDRSRRRPFGVAMLVLGVLGVIGALALWLYAGVRYDDAVADLAPAPVGCETTLEFDRTGTYTFFVETKGSVGQIDGDCDADDRSYDLGEIDPPEVSLTLLDEDGDEVALDRVDGPTYDRSGARGIGYRTAEIEAVGDYVLTADADDPAVMIRVGRNPSSGVTATRIGAIGLLVGALVLIVLGASRMRRPPTTSAPSSGAVAEPWPSGGYRPAPTAPPYANPPVPPPYAVPPRPAAPVPPAPARPPGGWPGSGTQLPPPSPPRR